MKFSDCSPALKLALRHHRNDRGERLTVKIGSYLHELYQDAWYRACVWKKCTQIGITEWAIVSMQALSELGYSQFHVTPTEPIRNRFIDNRLDKSIRLNPYYADRYTETDRKEFKLYRGVTAQSFVASNSTANFTEFSGDVGTVDEVDECNQANLLMVPERLTGSKIQPPLIRWIGNPKFPNRGIARLYRASDRRTWHVPCCNCGKRISPDWFRDVVHEDGTVRDRDWEQGKKLRTICPECVKPYDPRVPGEWVPEITERGRARGYTASKIFAGNATLEWLYLERFRPGIFDADLYQRFMNGDLGLEFLAADARINIPADIKKNYPSESTPTAPCYLGIDPGKRIHYVVLAETDLINEFNGKKILRLIQAGWVTNELEVDELFARYRPRVAVIDAAPEMRLVANLKAKHQRLFSCEYFGSEFEMSRDKAETLLYQRRAREDRTSSIDMVRAAIENGTIHFPRDAESLSISPADGKGELYRHITEPIRIYDRARNRFIWDDDPSSQDHLLHCLVYAMLSKNIYWRVGQLQ